MRFTIKDLALVSVMSAIVIIGSQIYLGYFLLILLAITLRRTQFYLIALVSAVLNFFLWQGITGDAMILLLNIFTWPMLVFIIDVFTPLIFNVPKGAPLIISNQSNNLLFFLVSLISIFMINLGGAYLNGILFNNLEAYFYSGILFYSIQGFLSALLLWILGFYLQKRIQKILLKMNF